MKCCVCHTEIIFKMVLLNHIQAVAAAAENTSCSPCTSSDAPGMLGEALACLADSSFSPFISSVRQNFPL